MLRIVRLLFVISLLVLPGWLPGAPRRKEQKGGDGASVTSSLRPEVTHLTVEGRVDPLGLDERQPRLGWQIADSLQDLVQRGYRILVASSPDSLSRDRGDLWDSGAVSSAESQWVSYGGKPLRPNQDCYWKVRVLTNHGTTDWSAPARWCVGLLDEQHWSGQWIGIDRPFAWDRDDTHTRLSARYVRRDFAVHSGLRRATLHIAGLGLYEAYVNGRRVGRQVMTPAQTDYRRNVIYNTYDITPLLEAGSSCLAVVLGNGRYYSPRQYMLSNRIAHYGFPTLRADLIIEYKDGTADTVATDARWKVTTAGPIRSNNLIDGESYDATREPLMADWMQPGYVDDFWMDADLVAEPGGAMMGTPAPSLEVIEAVRPVAVTPLTADAADDMSSGRGRYLLDFGRCITGRVRLHVSGRGRRGDRIRLRYSDALDADGRPDFVDADDAAVADFYTCNGTDTLAAHAATLEGAAGTWAPSFVTHRFRYVEVTNYPDAKAEDFVAEVISAPMRRTGTFMSSDTSYNRCVDEAYAALRIRCQDLPLTYDAPALHWTNRERQSVDEMPQPWVVAGAGHCAADAYLADVAPFYTKWLCDLVMAQRSDGAPADAAPAYWRSYSGDATVAQSVGQVVDMLRSQYGDVEPELRHAEALRRMAQYFNLEDLSGVSPDDSVRWAFYNAAGIRAGGDGFRQILLAPDFETSAMTHVDAAYDSNYGRIVSRWEIVDSPDQRLVWEVVIPGNTTARLCLPQGARMERIEGAPKSARKDRRSRTVTLGSGHYRLTIPLEQK